MPINLHNIVGNVLSCVNAWIDIILTRTYTEYKQASNEIIERTETIELKGKLQPVRPHELEALGFNIREFQYFKVFISGTPSQLDTIKGINGDTFTANGNKYQITGILPYDDAGFRECYCYLIDSDKE